MRTQLRDLPTQPTTQRSRFIRHMSSIMKRSACLLIVALPLAIQIPSSGYAAGASPTPVPNELLDQIVTTVNDNIILQSELAKRVREIIQTLPKGQSLPPKETLLKQVINKMVLETIQLEMADQIGIRVNDNELNDAILTMAERNDLSFDQFQDELSKQGIAYISYREQLRRDLMLQRVQKRYIGRRIQVTDQDAQTFLNSPLGQERLGADYLIQHILIEIEDQQAKKSIAKAEKKAEQIYQQLLKAPDTFSSLAIEHSSSSTALEGGNLGWRPAKELPTLFVDPVTSMSIGEVSKPIKSANGFHIIHLKDRRGQNEQQIHQLKVRHILIKPNEIRSRTIAKQMIDDLYEKLEDGYAFEQLAQTYSDDPGSARNGGDLGWVSPGQMVPQFEETMHASALNTYSAPFESPFGWHILEVTDKRTEDFSDEFRMTQAKNYVYKRKFEEELPIWLREIELEAFIEQKVPLEVLVRQLFSTKAPLINSQLNGSAL